MSVHALAVLLAALALGACSDEPLEAQPLDVGEGLDLGESDGDAAPPDGSEGADATAEDGAVAPDVGKDSAAPETIADSTAPETIEDSAAPEAIADSAAPEAIEDSAAPEAIEDGAAPEAIEDSAAPEAIEDSAVAEAIEDSAVADSAPEVSVADSVDALPPADTGALSAPPYLMWVTQSEVSVRWETKTPTVGRVDFGASDDLGLSVSEPSARTSHELRLTGLAPNQRHSYRVVYGGGALPLRHFYTAPRDDDAGPFRFIVWGDNQDGPGTFEDLVALMAEAEPRFAISVGDCVQNGTRDEYREQLFSPMAGYADEVPYLVAAGNHERYGDPDALLFGEYFSQPGDEHCFGWRYGPLFMLFLDTDLGLDGPTRQRACIEAALSSEAALGASIQAAAFHKPPRVEWWFGGLLAFPDSMEAPYVREELEPLLESHGVDVVFNGHNHLYAYTPETPGGITWVTTGGGGGRIDTRGLFDIWRVGTWPQIETTLHEFHFLRATVEGDELFIEAVDRDGEVMHSFYVYGD